jgi:hypothetical protein
LFIPDNSSHGMAVGSGFCLGLNRQGVFQTMNMRLAEFRQRTFSAFGIPWNAYARAQIHKSLIEIAGPFFRYKIFRYFLDLLLGLGLFNGPVYIEQSGHNPFYIGVHGRNRPVESHTGQGSGQVRAYTGQGAQVALMLGQLSIVFRHNLFRRLVQVPGSSVVPQVFPKLEYVIQG